MLDHVVFVFIPVYNIDGHERRSAYNRINQNGPEMAGWRGNGSNINLNRDYMKADAPETRAFLKMFHRWLPDFFVDDHVTDGMDFQYDVTFTADATPDVAPATAKWLREDGDARGGTPGECRGARGVPCPDRPERRHRPGEGLDASATIRRASPPAR